MFVSQPVVADRGPCRGLLRRLTWDKTFRLTENKREATIQKPHGKSTVAEIGAHGMGLEQAGKLKNMEIISGYWPEKESKTDGWGRVKETSPIRRPDNRLAWGTSKGPWGIPTPNYSNGCDCLWLTGDYANTCRLQQCHLTAEQQLQHHATASFKTFRCATECKSRQLSYKIYELK